MCTPVSSSDKNDIYMIYIYIYIEFTYAFISACTELHILIQVITFWLYQSWLIKMACVLRVCRLGLSRIAVPWNGCSPLKGRRIKAHGLKDAILISRDLVYGGITIHLDHLTVMLVKFAK